MSNEPIDLTVEVPSDLKHVFTVANIRYLEKAVATDQISYSRMAELMNLEVWKELQLSHSDLLSKIEELQKMLKESDVINLDLNKELNEWQKWKFGAMDVIEERNITIEKLQSEISKYQSALIEIQNWQFDNVQLARTTPIYKIAENVLPKELNV